MQPESTDGSELDEKVEVVGTEEEEEEENLPRVLHKA